jgi:hypothetical protein
MSGSICGVSAIHIDDIMPTVCTIENAIGITLHNNLLGSAGKKQISGDIDICINSNDMSIATLEDKLSSLAVETARSTILMTKIPVANSDKFVQVDFMVGDPGWLKWFYHASSTTNVKAGYRNILLAVYAKNHNAVASSATTLDGTPLRINRFMLSPACGLVYITRRPAQSKSGKYLKRHDNEITGGPWTTTTDIAFQLNLPSSAFDKFEDLFAAICNTDTDVTKIVKEFATDQFVITHGLPDVMKEYLC